MLLGIICWMITIILVSLYCVMVIKHKKMKCIDEIGELLIKFLPKWLIGSKDIIDKKVAQINLSESISSKELLVRNAKYVYLVITIFSILISYYQWSILSTDLSIKEINKPTYGNKDLTVETIINIEKDGVIDSKTVQLNIEARKLSTIEIEERINETKHRIETLIIGDNADLYHVNMPLELLNYDPQTSVRLYWESFTPQVISKTGQLVLNESTEDGEFLLIAYLSLEDRHERIEVAGKSIARPLSKNQSMESIMAKAIGLVESDTSEIIKLPKQVDEYNIQWLRSNHNYSNILLLILIIGIGCIGFGRYQYLNNKISEIKEHRIRALPSFITKIVLMLNSGLITQQALEHVIHLYDEKDRKHSEILYYEINQALLHAKENNISVETAIRTYGKRIKTREVQRIMNILADNMQTGSNIIRKLETELDEAWLNRKRIAEEKGKIAESQLSFPLGILLIVILVIVMTPAIMGI